ncbi:hypothetical protein [Streptomyces sp. PT12]|uniref:hypothetical protein n=1 Tax=Streptomyces sp. PT12 TaxID=1510197 RepID=UPI0015EE9653|nr:hypothetical protein [Streptomyces sp. PT12]
MPAIGDSEGVHAHDGRNRDRQWLTLPGRKKVLAVVHTVPYGKRLSEIVGLLAQDFRIQLLFTAPPHELGDGASRYLHDLGGPVLPWDEALRLEYDLVLAAGPRGMGEVRGPVVTVPHGASYLKRRAGASRTHVYGLGPSDILLGEDRRPPAAVVLPHAGDLRQLERSCPEAVPVATVVGDPVYDRIAASLPGRERYRTALGLLPDEELVTVVSTWGPHSSFGGIETLMPRLLSELALPGQRIALLLHPNVFSGHGSFQVRAWLSRCIDRGIAVVPPQADWRALLVAADAIIGDHGSVTLYGTLTEAPILLAASPSQEINPDSPAAALALTAPALTPGHALSEQLGYAAAEYRREEYAAIASRISSEPGLFARNMRRLLYLVLGLGQPAHAAPTAPLPLPPRLDTWAERRLTA